MAKKVTSARPIAVEKLSAKKTENAIKVATSNLFNLSTPLDNSEIMVELSYADLCGQEILNFDRSSVSVDGIDVSYHPIANIASVLTEANPMNLVSLQSPEKNFFESFPINLQEHLPNQTDSVTSNVTLDSSSQNIVISFIDIGNYQVEIQFFSSDSSVSQADF